MRIDSQGDFHYCRWANEKQQPSNANISNSSPITWFQKNMSLARQSMLDGDGVSTCSPCWIMEQHGKVSGRQRQLLKIGVMAGDFEKSLLSSPWLKKFEYSGKNSGDTDQWPQDWQIDLGNYCNSACVFCNPLQSSRLATEFKKLKLIDSLPPNSWCDDHDNIEKFVDVLARSPKLSYLHFLGGETLITPGFARILRSLIDRGINQDITIGFTTNLTVWNQDIIDMLIQFRKVNLGMSLECLHPLNDYVRYGSEIGAVETIMEKWIALGEMHAWSLQLRVTPSIFSIYYLDTIYEYAISHGVSVESCNFLEDPVFMKPSVLPRKHRDLVMGRLRRFIDKHWLPDQDQVINTRHRDRHHRQILQDAQSYLDYLTNRSDESHLLPDLVRFIKLLESNRNNSILDYLPEYEDFLRSAGY